MIKHYALIALRSLKRRPGYTFINAFSLAVGIACCILIGLWIRDELSYDRFYPDNDRIYRVLLDGVMSGREMKVPLVPYPLSSTLEDEIPEVAASTRLFDLFSNTMVRRSDGEAFLEEGFFYADSTFFEVFDLPFLEGDPQTALTSPRSVVLTQSMVQKYFPGQNPVGQSLTAVSDTTSYQVTGVIADLPGNSHFQFDFVAAMAGDARFDVDSWIFNTVRTYVRLHPEADPVAVSGRFQDIMRKYAAGDIMEFSGLSFDAFNEEGNRLDYNLQAVTDIHLRSNMDFEMEPPGSITFVYVFASIALLILLIACINFTNLATARSIGRAREIGVRKVLGSSRDLLVRQFLLESVLLSLGAMVLAAIIVVLALPAFNSIAGKSVAVGSLFEPWVMGSLLILGLGAGLLAGSYPAFFLSGFRPVQVLKGNVLGTTSGRFLRSGLVVFQFVISIALIAGTLIVQEQLTFIREKDPGFVADNLLVINRAQLLESRMEAFKEAVLEDPGVLGAGATSTLPGGNLAQWALRPEGSNSNEQILMTPIQVDHDYLELMGIEIESGRPFSRQFATDSLALILNQAAVRAVGWGDPLGHRLVILGDGNPAPREIVGVTRDYHVASFHSPVVPVMMQLATPESGALDQVVVRVQADDFTGTLSFLEQTWHEFLPSQPFEYSFLDRDLEALYDADRRLGTIFRLFAGLTIVIACLGLFGLTSHSVQQRTKEIGVRKVLGASVPSVVVLLGRDYLRLVGLAFLLATPLSYFVMREWLADFAYRISPGPLVFLAAGLIALLIAAFTLVYHTLRAATADPVESLRYE